MTCFNISICRNKAVVHFSFVCMCPQTVVKTRKSLNMPFFNFSEAFAVHTFPPRLSLSTFFSSNIRKMVRQAEKEKLRFSSPTDFLCFCVFGGIFKKWRKMGCWDFALNNAPLQRLQLYTRFRAHNEVQACPKSWEKIWVKNINSHHFVHCSKLKYVIGNCRIHDLKHFILSLKRRIKYDAVRNSPQFEVEWDVTTCINISVKKFWQKKVFLQNMRRFCVEQCHILSSFNEIWASSPWDRLLIT